MSSQLRLRAAILAGALLLTWGVNMGLAAPKDGTGQTLTKDGTGLAPKRNDGKGMTKQLAKITQKDRDAAAARALQKGALNPLMVTAQPDTATAAMAMPGMSAAAAPGDAPRYFSHPNYANSPLPEVTVTPGAETPLGNDLIDRQYATDTAANVLVMLPTPLGDGLLTAFETLNQAIADANGNVSAGKQFHAYVLRPTRFANQYSVVFDSGLLTVPEPTTPGVSEVAVFGVANLAVQAGDRIAFYGQGVPLDLNGTDVVSHPANISPLQGDTITVPGADFPVIAPRTYSFAATLAGADQVEIAPGTGIRKFVDDLPIIGAATPDTTSYPGSDFYKIGLVEYEQQMHSDLANPTKLRGYVQLNADGTYDPNAPSYLGPVIVAQKDRPVRIEFHNLLPTGAGGNLFLPVDPTVMGAGMTPEGHEMMEANPDMVDPQMPMCDDGMFMDGMQTLTKTQLVEMGLCYTENRAIIHLHGGITPWISDGTPHQWITPAGENTSFPEGVSVQNVPDMTNVDDSKDGVQTFYYTNAQSARLMFYHDHSWGITRLNVYAGQAAPYIIQDETEQALVDGGIIPDDTATIPLVFQDKTFVPNAAQLALQDETWDTTRWGGEGNLWLPHVYSPAQNPGDVSGVNAYGRWAYGPWFWPPTSNVEYGPIDNPYYDRDCDPDDPNTKWCEPPLMPGVPYNSMGMEAFMDTPVVNGKAYPTVTLEPKPYRFRILNAANDRFFNLSLYKAVDAEGNLCDGTGTPVSESTGVACTEVALNPAEVAAALEDPTVFPTPVAGTEGPDWIVMGTEGGFLPSPVVVPAHPTTWVNDPTVFNAGNVDQHSLLVAPAERFDVVVDLSAYAGQTLIVYNDAPAAFPARDPRYDYYTGDGDYRDSGGTPPTLPGYGPNTRTVMQIKVADAAAAEPFDLSALNAAFAGADGTGVFESGQKPIIVGQGEYNTAYGTSFPTNGPLNGTVQIYDTSLTFNRLVDPDADTAPGAPFLTSTAAERLTIDLKPKMIQDEMGEAFEHEYGRMSGFLGVETPNAQAGLQNMILYGFSFPPTEVLDGLELPPGMEATPIASAADGSQIWKFTHNGVDTHPIHFHLYDVQLLNRVGWDGIVRKPEATELGWKDTVRISPLEDTIVALRPIIPPIPDVWNGLPNSVRLLDPSMPAGVFLEGANTTQREALGLPLMAFNPDGEPIDVVNHYVNFGWEYVLHCHILSHEEMDMMRTQAVAVNPEEPTFISAVRSGNGRNRIYTVNWTDNSKNETAFVIERRVEGSTGPWTQLAMVQTENRVNLITLPTASTTTGAATGPVQYVDPIGNTNTLYEYNVYAINTVGDTWDYSDPAFNEIPAGGGFPTITVDSRGTAQEVGEPVDAPTALTGNLTVKNKKTSTVSLSWTDNSDNETGFLIQRTNSDGTNVVNATVGANATTFTQTVTSGVAYIYRVQAFSATTQSSWSNTLNLP
ncbi:multicopper oxidase domain-containing protein [Desulfoprunum benzoelyticum]|uniref:FtsP/CotA-like multicopper oxidase with cupredoxin domain n=1 Tax=Desulfoprunum benzoelyticum TaxID=1506996 RepID=A0A840V3Y5_9BACT|nr:multicopper oxidase domain-containing protein [Desulfoprunum benzoelyticum]MBB5347821.1 FtsP/CotA-like multicopper oxidase with cupredoxin domain [Desulfoprunum benzoelyticum]MBM9530684.1 multicopper oxidase domain-containing protein [Desulfoprunum benzoelyticum]